MKHLQRDIPKVLEQHLGFSVITCTMNAFCAYETSRHLSSLGLPEGAGKHNRLVPALTVARRRTGRE